jgi:phosphatidylserine/phosphatidylglycerophosphate/cardiolipin synthase-like enzyme
MPAPLFNAAKFKAATAMPSEAEDSAALASTQFDPDRWPEFDFPVLPVATATVAVSPDCSFRFLKKAIDSAQSTLLLYIYNVGAAYMLELLAAAKARGVKIRAMYDGTQNGADELAALKKVGKVKAAPAGGSRKVFTVCHQKFLVIDKKIVVVESANWSKTSVPQATAAGSFKKGNREWFIRIDDADVAKWFTKLFEADFAIPEDTGLEATPFPPPLPGFSVAAATQKPGQVFDFQSISDPAATVQPIISPNNYLSEVKTLLKSATKSIYLQQQYVLAGHGVKDLVQIMSQKKTDNPDFDIRVISSATFPANWAKTMATLDAGGLLGTLKAINPKSFTHCHNKGVIVDDQAVLVSSTNWSMNSITRAREAGVLVRSAKITEYYKDVFLLDWEEGLRPDDVAATVTEFDGADVV